MKPYYEDSHVTIYHGDCREVLPDLDPVETCITDPPYGLRFMGKEWDHEVPDESYWRLVRETVRPGGMLLAFGGTRLWHWLAVGIEEAGWEIRDTLMYMYGSGFPKGHRLDRALNLHLQEGDACHCGANRRSTARTSPGPRTAVHSRNRAPSGDGAPLLQGALRLNRKASDSRGDCQPGPHSDGGSPHPDADGGRASPPSQEYAPGRIRFAEPDDGPAGGQVHIPFRAPRIAPLTRPDCPAPAGEETSPDLRSQQSNISADTSESADRKAGNLQGLSYSTNTPRDPVCSVCGKPVPSAWKGWNVALKPAWEPIILAMNPTDGTFAENALEHRVAGLNIDGARIGTGEDRASGGRARVASAFQGGDQGERPEGGRWPANVVLDEEAAEMLDEQSGERPSATSRSRPDHDATSYHIADDKGTRTCRFAGDSGGASRFYYTSKASRADRGPGNDHPTVKPSDLMKWLCTLTKTPEGGTVLDPFMGSGTTLLAAKETGRRAIGTELEEKWCEIAAERLSQGVLDLKAIP